MREQQLCDVFYNLSAWCMSSSIYVRLIDQINDSNENTEGSGAISLSDIMTMSYSERFSRYTKTGWSAAPLFYKTQLTHNTLSLHFLHNVVLVFAALLFSLATVIEVKVIGQFDTCDVNERLFRE